MTHSKTIVQTLLLLLSLTACGPIDFQGQDLRITHDPKADTIELDLVYHGVMANVAHTDEAKQTWEHREAEDLIKAVTAIEEMAKGARRFVVISPMFVIDLDEREKLLRTELEGEKAAEASGYLDMIERISIEEVQISRDAKGRAQIHQRIQFKGAQRFTASLNKALRDGLLLWSEEEGSFMEDSAQLLDLETREAWLKEARAGRDWLWWDGTSLVVSMPMSPASTARLMRSTYDEIATEDEPRNRLAMAAMLSLISEFSNNDGRLTLRLDPNEQNALKFSIPEDRRTYAPSLVEALEAKAFPFSEAETKD